MRGDESVLPTPSHQFSLGMTIRENFAKAAMVAFIRSGEMGGTKHKAIAEYAVNLADYMLQELEKKP